ncbi:hypothetical protein [Peribacillus kribbensis]|uniref:hypothetical protein n=1 Tax=Peribacillus kribbensis TaxID=356658 RepID=UPI000401A7B9|nr:hypothetical protein [Peribacillus kribbensis]
MTLNLLLFTLIIKPNPLLAREEVHKEQQGKWREENVDEMLKINQVMQNKVW